MAFQQKKFQIELQKWYAQAKRDLPWRKTKDPYKILISEMMLQQTQVATVIPYYKKWIKKFPNFKMLAQAKESDVLKAWQGLGYYRRAKLLRLNAQAVCQNHRGKLPADYEALLALPGIGRYSAGAISSIAFEKKKAVLDGNVIRILTRLLAIKNNTRLPKTLKELWIIAEKILPEKNIGDFNQALMELGATICLPKNPRCKVCPVAFTCKALKISKQETFPVKTKAVKITKQTQYAFALLNKQKQLLIQKQKKGSRWAGLWTLPHFDSCKNGLAELGLKKSQLEKLQSNRHGYTRYQITLHAFKSLIVKKTKFAHPYVWAKNDSVENYAFPTVHQKIINEVLKK